MDDKEQKKDTSQLTLEEKVELLAEAMAGITAYLMVRDLNYFENVLDARIKIDKEIYRKI